MIEPLCEHSKNAKGKDALPREQIEGMYSCRDGREVACKLGSSVRLVWHYTEDTIFVLVRISNKFIRTNSVRKQYAEMLCSKAARGAILQTPPLSVQEGDARFPVLPEAKLCALAHKGNPHREWRRPP